MSQSLAFPLAHVVFSTKNRSLCSIREMPLSLHAYLAGIIRNAGCECDRVGGVADHAHIALRLPRTLTIAKLVQDVKASSSHWLKAQSAALANFSWQRGYGAFSVGPPI